MFRLRHHVCGRTSIVCDAVIAATGCRERTIPQLDIPGSRPTGIFTAGSAQLMVNIKNYLPGKSAVILGSGDIGLIMARRMTLEGIKVKLVLGEKATGLARNIVQCIDDFNIPIRYGWTVAATHGYKRLKGVTVIEKKTGKTEYIPCDTLLVAAGLVPETELFSTSCESDPLYFCGNADHVHDLVDNVTLQAVRTAVKACKDAGLEYVSDEVGRYLTAKPVSQPKEKKGGTVCTVCPQSCIMDVQTEPFSINGNMCNRGKEFAKQEIVNPQRTVTTVISAKKSGYSGIVPVRTKGQVNKRDIPKVMKAARSAVVNLPAHIGQEILSGEYTFLITDDLD